MLRWRMGFLGGMRSCPARKQTEALVLNEGGGAEGELA